MKKLLTMMAAAVFGCPLFGALTDGLVAHYKFDGNANDSSGNGNNGVVHGATLTTDRFGNANGAYEFNGGNWISVENSDSLSGIGKSHSVSFWLKADAWNNDLIPVLDKGESFGCLLQKKDRRGGTYTTDLYVGPGMQEDDFELGTDVVMGSWHHWVIVTTDSGVVVYVDGVQNASHNDCIHNVDTSRVLYIGTSQLTMRGSTVDDTYLEGALDELRVYNRALSAAEVKTLYGETDDGLVGWYNINVPDCDVGDVGKYVEEADGVFRLVGRGDRGAALFLTVEGAGTIAFKARGSRDGFFYSSMQGNCYVRSDSFDDHSVTFPDGGQHSILWATYAKGYIIDEAWGEVTSITWNGRPVEYNANAPMNGLVAWYKFDGNTRDSQGCWSALANTSMDIVYIEDRKGTPNSAVELQGDNCLYNNSGNTNEELKANFTFACWFKATEDTVLVNESSSGINGTSSSIKYLCGATMFPVAVGKNGINVFEHSYFHLPAILKYEADIGTEWNHLAMTVSDSGGPVIYLNGREIGRRDRTDDMYVPALSAGGWDNGSAQRYVGIGSFSYGGHFAGGVDDVMFYNRVLSAAEVKALYEEENDKGLVAWYKFDGNANDSSGNGNNGVVHGATLTADRFGNPNGAYSFGGDDWIQVANSASLSLPTKAMSFCVWMRTEVEDGWVPFLSKGTSSRQYGFELGYGRETTLFINDYNGTGCGRDVFVAVDSVSLNSGAWHFVVLTYDGNEIKAYANGELIASRAVEDSFVANSSDLYIGKDIPEVTEYFSGAMDDLRIYNRALSAAEVKALYEGAGVLVVTKCAVTFDAAGGSAGWTQGEVAKGAAVGTLPTATREGYEFFGWFTAAVGGTQVTAATVVTEDVTFYARWTPIVYGISYTGVKGGVNPNPTSYTIEDAITFTALSDVTGYRFTGWSPRAIEAGTTGDKTIAAQYAPIVYSISYANTMGASNPNPTSYTIESEIAFAPLADIDGWMFTGWSFRGVARGTTGDLTVSANWEKVNPPIVPDDDEPMDAGIANNYDGVIVDADGLPLGYVTVKAAKASGKGDVRKSKVTVTIQMVGETKKVTVKGDVDVAEAELVKSATDGRVLDLVFTRDTIFGTFDDYQIEGVRNLLASTAKGDKGSAAKTKAEGVFNLLKGNYVMAYGDEYGYNGLSVSIMAKGKVKVSGKLANGTSVSTTSQLIVGDDYSCIPVIYTKKDTLLAFNVYFSNDGAEATVFGYYDAAISPVGGIAGACSFVLGGDFYGLFDEVGYELLEEFLPREVSVVQKGSKWIVADGAKAGQIKLVDGEVVDKKESENPSGLKLTFTAKTGIFKGTFKAYALDINGKLKSFSATVNGVVVDGFGYGTATIKKIGAVAVTIE